MNEVGIAERWRTVQGLVARACARSGRQPSGVQIVAVSKTVNAERIREGYKAGIRAAGENYVQEVLPKMEALRVVAPDLRWHFIGSLQSNKAKQVVGRFDLIHSLDRISLADALEKERKKQAVPVRTLVEINVAEEHTKTGTSIAELKPLLEYVSARTGIEVLGLMVFPPLSDNPEASRRYFARAREIRDTARSWNIPRIDMRELSMGVTSDFEVAIEEGATIVRIGTAIFGSRGRN